MLKMRIRLWTSWWCMQTEQLPRLQIKCEWLLSVFELPTRLLESSRTMPAIKLLIIPTLHHQMHQMQHWILPVLRHMPCDLLPSIQRLRPMHQMPTSLQADNGINLYSIPLLGGWSGRVLEMRRWVWGELAHGWILSAGQLWAYRLGDQQLSGMLGWVLQRPGHMQRSALLAILISLRLQKMQTGVHIQLEGVMLACVPQLLPIRPILQWGQIDMREDLNPQLQILPIQWAQCVHWLHVKLLPAQWLLLLLQRLHSA